MHPDPIPELKQAAGAALARRISGWASAHDAAALLCTERARILDIRRGTLKRFSLETLLRLLVRAGAAWRSASQRHATPSHASP